MQDMGEKAQWDSAITVGRKKDPITLGDVNECGSKKKWVKEEDARGEGKGLERKGSRPTEVCVYDPNTLKVELPGILEEHPHRQPQPKQQNKKPPRKGDYVLQQFGRGDK